MMLDGGRSISGVRYELRDGGGNASATGRSAFI